MSIFYLFGAILIFVGWLAAYQAPVSVKAKRPALFTVIIGVALIGAAWGMS